MNVSLWLSSSALRNFHTCWWMSTNVLYPDASGAMYRRKGNWLNRAPTMSMLANSSVNNACKSFSSLSSALYLLLAIIDHSVFNTPTLNASLISIISPRPSFECLIFSLKSSTSWTASSCTSSAIVLLPKPNSRKWRNTNRRCSTQNSSSVSRRPARKQRTKAFRSDAFQSAPPNKCGWFHTSPRAPRSGLVERSLRSAVKLFFCQHFFDCVVTAAHYLPVFAYFQTDNRTVRFR